MKRKMLTFLMACVLIASMIPMMLLEMNAASIEDDQVFLNQQTNYTCTLVSATMMVRRTAILAGLENWESITESSMRKVAWKEGAGLYYNFSYTLNGVKITVKGYENGLSGSYETKKAKLIKLLGEHPEGVVIYNHYPAHAILLTKYDESTDTFYCADPAPNITRGQIPLSKSSLAGSGQTEKISGLDTYWIVTSPDVTYDPVVNASVPDGTYYFSSHEYSQEEHSHMYMKNDSGSNNAIGLSGGETDESAKFEIKKDGNYYLLQPTTTQKGYVVATYWSNGSSTQSGDAIALWENDGDLSQRWIFEEFEGGYVIRPADNTGLAWTREGGRIILRPFESYSSQVWTLEDASVCVHDYQYKADAEVTAQSNHWKECTKCGDIIEYRHHSWDIVCLDNRVHAVACKVCGVALEKDLHFYSSVCDPSCNGCDYLRDASHNFQVEYDSTHHWEACICFGCDQTRDKSEHIYRHEIRDGYEIYSCTGCEYSYRKAVSTPPSEPNTEEQGTDACTEHSYGAWEPVRASTCTEEGEERQVCTVCGHTNHRNIPMVSHEYGDWYEAVDEEGNPVLRSDCKNCSDYLTQGEGEPPSTEPVQETDTEASSSTKPEVYFGCLGSLHISATAMIAVITAVGICMCRKKKD